jgi:hypothetical protein
MARTNMARSNRRIAGSILDCVMCAQPASNTPISLVTGLCMRCAEVATRRQQQQNRANQ